MIRWSAPVPHLQPQAREHVAVDLCLRPFEPLRRNNAYASVRPNDTQRCQGQGQGQAKFNDKRQVRSRISARVGALLAVITWNSGCASTHRAYWQASPAGPLYCALMPCDDM